MAIDPTRSLDAQARAMEAAAELGDRDDTSRTDKQPVRGDQVQISDEARALAELNDVDGIPGTQAQLAEIQDRLDSGFYERPEVIDEIAGRILDSGDL